MTGNEGEVMDILLMSKLLISNINNDTTLSSQYIISSYSHFIRQMCSLFTAVMNL